MRGIVLAYNRETDAGIIRGDDGNRYGFRARDWRERAAPLKGTFVDFEADGSLAREIYAMSPEDAVAAPSSFATAARMWIANHPEAIVALFVLIACGLPFYRFLGIETTLYQVPEIILRLSSGLERIRALAQQSPDAVTAVAVIKMLLPGIYVLWLVPLLAVLVLYKALFDLPRLTLMRVFGLCAVALPVLVPLAVVVPTWILVVQAIPTDQQVTIAHSVFDLSRFGPLREMTLGVLATMILGLGVFLWAINPDNVDHRAAARQGSTHRSGRAAKAGQQARRQGHQGPAHDPRQARRAPQGPAEAFAPPRLRSRDPQADDPLMQQHPGAAFPPMQPPRQEPPFPIEESAPHHDPIPESLRRRFEERRAQNGQQPSSTPQGAQPAALPPPSAFDDQPMPSPVDPEEEAAATAARQDAPLPDARDGQGVAADVNIAGWSVDPGNARYNFNAWRPQKSEEALPEPEADDRHYAALAKRLGLQPVRPEDRPPPKPSSANVAAPPPSQPQPQPGANGATPPAPPPAPPAESQAQRPSKNQPPPPKDVADFLRALDEPDGLKKLAAAAPPFAAASAKRDDEKQGPPAPSKANGSGASLPPSGDSTLDKALERAMGRLNGVQARARSGSSDPSERPDAESPNKEPDTVTALYERLRKERLARETKSDLPIPPTPPRR